MHSTRTKPFISNEKKYQEFDWQLDDVHEDGSFAGYASVFNVLDSHQDIMMQGAFRRTLLERKGKVKLLWQHDFSAPIGTFTCIREDSKGLYVEGKLLLDVQRGGEAHSLLKAGAMNGLSIGYTVVDYAYDDKAGARLLKDVDLWEISLVTFPANESATITRVKSAVDVETDGSSVVLPETLREFEHFLRLVGFSRRRAKHIALNGFQTEMSGNELRMWKQSWQNGDVIRFSDACTKALYALLH